MIPIGDNIQTQRAPVIVVLLVLINIAIFVYTVQLDLNAPDRGREFHRSRVISERYEPSSPAETFMFRWGVRPDALLSRPFPRNILTPITSMFLHGSILHLLMNMLALWVFGNNIEDLIGHFSFIFFYFACGIAAVGTQVAFQSDSSLPMIGASGAIAGVMGAYLVKYPFAQVRLLIPLPCCVPIPIILRVPAIAFLLLWIAGQVVSAMQEVNAPIPTSMVAWYAHLGGFAAGILLIMLVPKQRQRTYYTDV